MEKALTTTEQAAPSIFMDKDRFNHFKDVAKMLSASSLVPTHFQNGDGVGNVMIVLNLAERMRLDPFMLMQNIYVVHGRPGLEGKLVIALVNGGGRFEPLEYELSGNGKTDEGIDRPEKCRSLAKDKKSGKTLHGPWVTWAQAKAEGWTAKKGNQVSKWQTIPELMFHYRSATFFARVHCPEVLMGLQTSEEIGDVIDVTPREQVEKVIQQNANHEGLDIDESTGEIVDAEILEPEEKEDLAPPDKSEKQIFTEEISELAKITGVSKYKEVLKDLKVKGQNLNNVAQKDYDKVREAMKLAAYPPEGAKITVIKCPPEINSNETESKLEDCHQCRNKEQCNSYVEVMSE